MFIYGVMLVGILLTIIGVLKMRNIVLCSNNMTVGTGFAFTIPLYFILFGLYILIMAINIEPILMLYTKIFLGIIGPLLFLDSVTTIRNNYSTFMKNNKERKVFAFLITTAFNFIGLVGGIIVTGLLLLIVFY